MGLFSKLFGNANQQIIQNITNDLLKKADQSSRQDTSSQQPDDARYKAQQSASELPSGFSWGYTMPDEENQYNFNGSYVQYFENIFRTEFPEYQTEYKTTRNMMTTVFTLWKDGKKALVVEVLSKTSNTKKLRTECQNANIPYLRFYHNYQGWWNTKKYVVTRAQMALSAY